MRADDDEQTISARWVFPATSPPLAGGTVTIRGDRITSVDRAGVRTPDLRFDDAAIIPGLVNAHTHLDLSGLRGLVPPTADFVGWLRGVIGRRRERSPEQTAADIRAGLDESMRYGTTLVGDIAAGGASWDALASAPVWSICFRELLGLPGNRVHAVWEELVCWVGEHPDSPTCRVGVSPHAPFSVHKSLIEAAARLWPVCIHLAESVAERDLLERRDSPFVPFLRDLGVWDPSGLAPSWDWVLWKVSRAPAALLAHGNYLSDAPIAPNSTVVYCPRTHAAFDHRPHPFREMIDRGVRVTLGTDSLASNPDLDLLAEARFLHTRYPDIYGEHLLCMATINGATALGLGGVTGSLEPGKSADLVLVPLPEEDAPDPYKVLFAQADVAAPRKTMWRGQWRQAR
jgi:aminodeoxyfutalosine deaminase